MTMTRSLGAGADVIGEPRSLTGPYPFHLVDAAMRLADGEVARIVRASLSRAGSVSTWEHLIRPTLAVLEDRRDVSDVPTTAEFCLRRTVFETLVGIRRLPSTARLRVLLACADEEHETLPLDVVAAALEESGARSAVLGARVPPQALASAVRRLRPAVVVLWSHTSDTADYAQITAVLSTSVEPAVVAAGPGWHSSTIPQHLAQPLDVGGAVTSALAGLPVSVRHR